MPPVSDRPVTAVRVLHTSDWHLGVSVRNLARSDDHDAVIAEIVAIAAAAGPDLILHTGDLFDGPRPPMTEFGRAIRALRALAEVAPVVVLAGNHDSATALEVLGMAVGDALPTEVADGRAPDPFAPCAHRIRVHHRPGLPEKGAVATYATAAGWDLRLAVLPFVHANRLLTDFAHLVEPNATYNDSVRKVIGTIGQVALAGFDPTRQVAVFASHLHVAGASTSSEKSIHVSTDYATDPAHLSGSFGYLAFGHIHVPQAIAGGRGTYAGSVLEVDFGEAGEAKRVVVVDLEPGRPSRVQSISLTAGRRLRRVGAPLADLAALADEVGTAIVEVTVLAAAAEPSSVASDGEVIEVDGVRFDTLSAAVRAVLPDATVVSVVDGRNPHVVVADDLVVDGGGDSVEDAFRAWLVDAGDGVVTAHGEGVVDLARLVELFDELHAAAGAGETPTPREVAELDVLLAGPTG